MKAKESSRPTKKASAGARPAGSALPLKALSAEGPVASPPPISEASEVSESVETSPRPVHASVARPPGKTRAPARIMTDVGKAKTSSAAPPIIEGDFSVDENSTRPARAPAVEPSRPAEAIAEPIPPSAPPHQADTDKASSGGAEDAQAREASTPDWDRLARNMGQLIEHGTKAASALFKPKENAVAKPSLAADVSDMVKTLGEVAGHWMADPARMMQAQAALSTQFVDLWSESLRRLSGGAPAPESTSAPVADKRFAAPEWRTNPVFNFLSQSYLMTTDWASAMVEEAEGLHPVTREKARFYLRQVSSALAPSNFLATNPELLRTTFQQSGDNLVRGMKMLAEDIEAGEGELRIRQSDRSTLKLGIDMATTPGKVVFRNDLMELIQYAPATPDVLRRPLLIVPPWINKFYVLDLNPEKSLIRWMVERGLTVFVVSWVNPDERHADKGFEAYMREGIFAALDAIELATGERQVSTIGYCVGGTLLAVALAFMAAQGDDRIASTTFFTAQTDFREAGDLKVFAGEEQIAAMEAQMAETGYLKGSKMANAFNMLRPNELIWNYVVNNYLKGQAPSAFDLLVWNADSTRMPAANHAFYLRNCYLENRLTQGEMEIGGVRLDLTKVTIPIYNLATREDHIAPARSVFTGAKYFSGPMRYVLAGSGHIAGVVNPPAKGKYQYWSGPPVEGSFEDWLAAAKETKGSWWPDWLAWVSALAPERAPARVPGAGQLPALADAPGDYVRVQA